MQSINFDEVVDKIVAQDSRYHRDAYFFLREALGFTQKIAAKSDKTQVRHHVSGRELLDGIREHALFQFGPMAFTVLDEWGIHATEDFGEMVFKMVEHNLLAKTESDSREDFKSIYNFDDAFKKPFVPSSKLAAQNSAAPEAKS